MCFLFKEKETNLYIISLYPHNVWGKDVLKSRQIVGNSIQIHLTVKVRVLMNQRNHKHTWQSISANQFFGQSCLWFCCNEFLCWCECNQRYHILYYALTNVSMVYKGEPSLRSIENLILNIYILRTVSLFNS